MWSGRKGIIRGFHSKRYTDAIHVWNHWWEQVGECLVKQDPFVPSYTLKGVVPDMSFIPNDEWVGNIKQQVITV